MSWKNGGGAKNFAVIAEDDGADIAWPPEYVHVETAGNLVVKNKAGTTITLAVNAGDMIPISPTRLMAATSCGQVVGFWDD